RGWRRRLEDATEHIGGILHLLHRAERDARPLLLERGEVAADHYALRGAALAERRRRHRLADLAEDEVGLRVGRGVAHVRERLDREVADRLVAGALVIDVR